MTPSWKQKHHNRQFLYQPLIHHLAQYHTTPGSPLYCLIHFLFLFIDIQGALPPISWIYIQWMADTISHRRLSQNLFWCLRINCEYTMHWNRKVITPLQWRHNEHDGIANHQPHNCLLKRLFGCRSKKTSKLCVTGLCAGNSPVTGEFPAQRPVTQKMFPLDNVSMTSGLTHWPLGDVVLILMVTFQTQCIVWYIEQLL